jgi:hypothetical protein
MDPEELAGHVEGIVHEPTQVHDGGVDLTADEVFVVDEPGRVDFGGGELEPAALEPHERVWRDENDDYQWWSLSAGTYLLEYNESIAGSMRGRVQVQTRDELRKRGAYHPTLRVHDLGHVPLTVAGDGVLIKENARVSTLLP